MAIATKPKYQTHGGNKRMGGHHKHGSRYLKTYWPYLPLLAIISLGIVFNGLLTSHMYGVDGYSTAISPATLLSKTNSNRATSDEPALTINPDLAAAAQAKANDMVQKNYWAHVSPNGTQPWQFITNAGYQYQSAGENLAYGFGSSAQVLAAWMNSPKHRANVLDKNYQNVGFGIANSPNFQGNGPATIVVAEYGQPLAPVATTASTKPNLVISTAPDSQSVDRVQLLSSNLNYSVVLVIVIAGLAALIFILRHGLAFRRLVLEGEHFILHHRYLDIIAITLVVAGVILTRTVGVIH